MSDDAYRNALARRSELTKEIERIDSFIEMYREFSGSPTKAVDTEARAERGAGAKIGDVAHAIISAAGRPVPRPELLMSIEATGLKIGGKDPAATLASALWRDKERFVSIKNYGYWLKEKPYPHALYDPWIGSIAGVTDDTNPVETDAGAEEYDS
jgi:hypothetical protein